MSEIKEYKLIIIGAGPAGMTASIYASRYKIPHLIISSNIGGAAAEAHLVENWPGEKQIKGADLMNKFWEHAQSYNPDYWPEEAKGLEKTEDGFRATTSGGKSANAPALIFAGGTQYKRLFIPGEKELLGRGVSYCATCDGGFFKEKKVAVIGGANSAVMAAAELAQHASQVYLIHRSELKAEPIWIDRLKANEKISFIPETNIIKITGENKVEKVALDKPYQGKTELLLDGVFIEIGVTPLVDLLKSVNTELDANGSIKINEKRETNIPGIFAAGDATSGSGGFRQMITAASEGAIAARGVFEYLKEKGLI
ncbi:MAG: FAD-dependent oxidoreductase [Candidatus Moraniibacteriota bacterium]